MSAIGPVAAASSAGGSAAGGSAVCSSFLAFFGAVAFFEVDFLFDAPLASLNAASASKSESLEAVPDREKMRLIARGQADEERVRLNRLSKGLV